MTKKKRLEALGLSDERFAHLRSDPKFSALSNREKKVIVEKRFAAALKDEKFSSKTRVDKWGRPVRKTINSLSNLYELRDSDDEDVAVQLPVKRGKIGKVSQNDTTVVTHSKSDENDDIHNNHDSHRGSDEEAELNEEDKLSSSDSDDGRPFKFDLARGEGNIASSSDDDDSEWDEENDETDQLEIDLAHLDQDAEQVEWATNRLAACNMDWNLVHCEDLMVLAKSFTPPGGSIRRITIYLSDFGSERLAEEDKYGPKLKLNKPIEEYDGEEIDDETRLAIRRYQVEQLRYYYAVIECDSVETAVAIYDHCDGYHFESSDLKMDLRFVPDGMEFDKERIKEELCEEDVNISKYKSKEKLKSAVALSNARIAWDETEELRSRKFAEAFNSDEECPTDLIACSDSDGDSDKEKNRETLLSLISNDEVNDGLQVDWYKRRVEGKESENEENDDGEDEGEVKDIAKNHGSDESDDDDVDLAVKPKKKEKNTYKAYLERRREKKAKRREQLRELRQRERERLRTAGDQAKVVQKKNRVGVKAAKKKEEEKCDGLVEAVANDERFKALFTDSAFAIEQSSKNYKGSKLIEKQVSVKWQAEKSMNKTKTKENDLISKLKEKSAKWKG
ncbi:hypothetical protein KIN20_014458 [Parelaphostrongylus tenuis]|uniref:NUC153 domain-containing protein n=1 Tax=Parelaphostrongylus tenuis TaxID=148309 RepID=A0AAD5MDP1_PARTN|nr:hypothetical protein KIN20_014458 [Parelaphostrongylus tenuis]